MMQETNKKIGGNEDFKKKERHIVTWTQEEDDILREQISLHGTENWAIIASKFKDKTTRQCRRRWYTYLNSDFKKGGWSPEEDMLLCEAQKVFGNRWTEIAKVVSGRTDNAVKNRFSTLCKKRAKYEALAKENTASYINPNNKRILLHNGLNVDGTADCTGSVKRMRRSHIDRLTENCNFGDRSHRVSGTTVNQQLRHPFAVLGQNLHNASNVVVQSQVNNVKEVSNDARNNRTQGTFLKKDDPKINALMQQAELLSSLALKVNSDNTDQSLENAWKVRNSQDFLNQSKENDILRCTMSDIDLQLEDFKDLLEDLRSSNEASRPSWRIILSSHIGEQNCGSEERRAPSGANTNQVEVVPSCNDQTKQYSCFYLIKRRVQFPGPKLPHFSDHLQLEFPAQFSESERNFLLKTLGMESPSPNPGNNLSQPPPCKRVLLHSL
ncbi:hypothetical protein V6N12_019302 [Hibiscus sabdariffa]|uniref:Uncharacterized protein n=1 Tax=Hibiscus sabdariffa TaxID=183260 RepID=A0ABR2AKR6_9ROSI